MSKSRPLYRELALDPAGRAHLVVSDQSTLTEAEDLLAAGARIWLNGAPVEAAPGHGASRSFRAVAEMFAGLRDFLARGTVGLRVYAVGTEAFVWDAHNIAAEAGLGAGEIFLTRRGSGRRRVFCVHCKTFNEDVTTSIVACRACGARLFVREHFSRRLAAFMGVAVDAEAPGEAPAAELLFP